MECRVGGQPHKTPHFHPRHRCPPGMTSLPRRAWVRLNRLYNSIGRFRSCLYKWGMASSAVCECGAEEQTVDHVVLQCPIDRPPHGLHGLTVQDDETTEWLLNICTRSSAAKQWFEQLTQKKKKTAIVRVQTYQMQLVDFEFPLTYPFQPFSSWCPSQATFKVLPSSQPALVKFLSRRTSQESF